MSGLRLRGLYAVGKKSVNLFEIVDLYRLNVSLWLI